MGFVVGIRPTTAGEAETFKSKRGQWEMRKSHSLRTLRRRWPRSLWKTTSTSGRQATGKKKKLDVKGKRKPGTQEDKLQPLTISHCT